MNENVRVFLGFVAGAVISGVATYLVTEKKLSREFELALDEYKASVEVTNEIETVASEANRDEILEEAKATAEKIDIPESAVNAYKQMQEGIKKAKKEKRAMTDYSGSGPRRDIEGDFDDRDDQNESAKMLNHRPIVVSFDEYNNNPLGYRQVELYYNEIDYRLFDDDGSEVDSPDVMIGYENLDMLSESDESDMYVRNDNLKEYYFVSKEYRY